MTLPAHKQSKTMVQTSKKLKISQHLSDGLRNEYVRRFKDLRTTAGLIIEELGNVPELRGIKLSRAEVSLDGGEIMADVSYNVSVDGMYQKKDLHVGFVDPKTLNLLLNSKILNETEKRALLRQHGLLPEIAAE